MQSLIRYAERYHNGSAFTIGTQVNSAVVKIKDHLIGGEYHSSTTGAWNTNAHQNTTDTKYDEVNYFVAQEVGSATSDESKGFYEILTNFVSITSRLWAAGLLPSA